MKLYCTYFDSSYLARGLVMLESLCRLASDAEILVLALDDCCEHIVRERFPERVSVVGVEPIHRIAPRLPDIRRERSAWAYYATQKPALAEFAMDWRPRPEAVIYLDADLWFFADPAPVFDEIGEASIGISPHSFHETTEHLSIFGTYNAGWIYWRNDAEGRRCVTEWLDECLEWCAEEPQPDGRFMNQGYLNSWPQRYDGVHVLRHPGANVAPWNIDGRLLEMAGQSVRVDGWPLLFYHYHGLKRDSDGIWHSAFPHLENQFPIAWNGIYRPHLEAIERERKRLLTEFGIPGLGSAKPVADFPPVRFGAVTV